MSQQERTVLIVDDSAEDRELYRRYLAGEQKYSYHFIEAELGEEGLELWQKHQPDVVLLDYRLPDLDGLEFLARLPTQQSSELRSKTTELSLTDSFLPVIVVTGQGNEAIAVKAIKSGAQDYLIKGQIFPENLQLAVHGIIEAVQLRSQLQQRIEGERLIAQISQQIYQSLAFDEILETTVTEVRQFLHTDRVLIFQLMPDGNGTVVAESVKAEWQALLSSNIYDPCLAEDHIQRERAKKAIHDPDFNQNYLERYRQGEVTAKSDIYDGSVNPCHVNLLAQFQVKANLVVPILDENQFWGLLIAHHCVSPRVWQPLEINLLQQLTTHVSIALQQARLYQQARNELIERQKVEINLRYANERLQRKLAEIEAIYQTAPIGLSVLDTELRFVRINQRLAEINGYPIEAHIGRTVRELLPDLADSAEQLLGSLLETGTPQLNIEVRGKTRALQGLQRIWLEHFLPLKNGDRIIGISIVCEEITERKRAEELLQQSEEMKRRMLESSSDCIKLLDLEGRLLYMNAGGMCLMEIENLDSCLNQQWVNFWQEEALTEAKAALDAAKAGNLHRFQGYCPTVTGKPKFWDVIVSPILDARGKVVQILATSRDLTEQQQTQIALRENEERLRTLANNMSQFAWMADANGWIFWYNKRWFDYTGTTLEEMQGWGWQKIHHPEHVERVVEHLRSCFKIGASWEDTFPLLGRDGKYRWFLSRAIPIRNEEGEIVRWFGTNTDIEELRQTELDLRESEERYRCLAELIPQLVWTSSAKGMILDVNQRWLDFTGLTVEQIKTLGWEELIHPEDLPILSQQWTTALQTGTYYQAEGRMRQSDGTYRWHLHQAVPQKNKRGQIVKWFGTATDIEAQKQLQIERDRVLEWSQTARAEAERANRIKDEFLTILSHELRSPLNPILGWVQLLQTQNFDPSRTAQGLETIERNAKLQAQLIDDLLDVAKILRGKLSMNVGPLNPVLAIEAAIDTVKTAAVAKSISLQTNLANIGQISGDAARIQQIVWNLLSNAIKFTSSGGEVNICLERVANFAQIKISDNGKGINADFLPYMFEYFRQEDASITRKYGGLGLGLAIVRHLVEAHGGTISADSDGEGLGATFTVRLPLLDLQPEIKQTHELLNRELDLTGIRVLCVDDEPDTRELLGVLLTQYGAEVMTVSSAAEVMTVIDSFCPDILISDIGMPKMDGYTLMEQIRSLPPHRNGQIPAIALTAYAGEIDRKRALSVGFQKHIAKPVEPIQLAQSVLAIVRNN
jgi:PAS domain S-box-containing protein